MVQVCRNQKVNDMQPGCSHWDVGVTYPIQTSGDKKKTREYTLPEVDDNILQFSRKRFMP